MATFESKVSEIFNEKQELWRSVPLVIRKLFNESKAAFNKRIDSAPEDVVDHELYKLYDILYIDFYYNELDDTFLNWVIQHRPDRFTEAELEEMRAQAASHLDFYEVTEVIPGKGSYIKSLFTHEDGFLKDISSSSQLVKWDIIMTRCYFYNDAYRVTGALLLFKPSNKQDIVGRIEEARSKYSDTSPDSEYATFAKNHWDIFYQIEREIREKEMNKKFYTSYGELQLCEVRFRVNDIQLILNKIKHLEEFNFIDIKEIRRGKKKSFGY